VSALGDYLLSRNEALAADPLMRRLRGQFAAREAAAERELVAAAAEAEVSRFAPPPGGWPAPSGCDCRQCRDSAARGLLTRATVIQTRPGRPW
jgi:hypothetical protein